MGNKIAELPQAVAATATSGPAQHGEAYGDWASDNQQLIQVQEAVGERDVLHQTLEDHQATLAAKKEKVQFQA